MMTVAYSNYPPDWRKTRLRILQRDGWRCRICGRKKRKQIHHIRPVVLDLATRKAQMWETIVPHPLSKKGLVGEQGLL
jgi:5-methylcytosine-specific restriction endonuclease McrA